MARLSIVLSALVMSLSGCATAFSKSTYPVAISSHPPGQPFSVTDYDGRTVAQGVTPSTDAVSDRSTT